MGRLAGLLLGLLLAGPVPTRAQGRGEAPSRVHRLAVEVGGVWQGLDDVMATPMRYTGTGVALGAAYERRGARWRLAVRGAAALPRLSGPLYEDDAGYAETAWVTGSSYVLRALWQPRDWVTVWAGPGLAGEASRRRHTYIPGGQVDFGSGFLALQLAGLAEVELGRYGGLSEMVAVPLLGLAARKEYAGVEGQGPRVTLALPPSFLLVHHRLIYRLPGTGAVGAYVFHDGSLVRHTDPLELASISHRFGVGVVWAWGLR